MAGSVDDALRIEREAIMEEAPLHNVMGRLPPSVNALRNGAEIRRAARQELADATEERKRRAPVVEQQWRQSICQAVAGGVPVVEVAALAGISRERVYQIRRQRTEETS
jgi:hypothetical protein